MLCVCSPSPLLAACMFQLISHCIRALLEGISAGTLSARDVSWQSIPHRDRHPPYPLSIRYPYSETRIQELHSQPHNIHAISTAGRNCLIIVNQWRVASRPKLGLLCQLRKASASGVGRRTSAVSCQLAGRTWEACPAVRTSSNRSHTAYHIISYNICKRCRCDTCQFIKARKETFLRLSSVFYGALSSSRSHCQWRYARRNFDLSNRGVFFVSAK